MKTIHDMTKEYRSSIGVKFALSGGLGLLNTTFIHTPASAYVNEFLNRMMNKDLPNFKETPWTKVRIFNGLPAHNTATITMVGCSITTNDYICTGLTLNGYQLNYQNKYFISILSGAFAGIFASPIEAVAQAQQRQSVQTPLTTMQVVKSIYKNNGITAFSRGMAATVGRSAGFTSGYLGLMPLLVDTLKEKMGDTPLVYLIAGILSGSLVGTITAPLNTLQFKRKNLIDKESQPPGYREMIKTIIEENKASSRPLRNTVLSLCGNTPALATRILSTSAQFTFLYAGNRGMQKLLNEIESNNFRIS